MEDPAFTVPDGLDELDPHWLAGLDAELLRQVRAAYDSPGRHYHGWPHIEACLREYVQLSFDDAHVVLLALLFHDAVYVAGRHDNEARSAEWADVLIRRHSDMSDAQRREISALILLTASHHAHGSLSPDAEKLIDIDLAVLGASWPVYQAYAQGVRDEYCGAGVPPAAYVAGRIAFLDRLGGEPHIFLTERARGQYESAARRNIAAERAMLCVA
jgi:predicted metal-dependent HD superfamily phosphohydrolase